MRRFPGKINKLRESIPGMVLGGALANLGVEGRTPEEIMRRRKIAFKTGAAEVGAQDVNDKIYRSAIRGLSKFTTGGRVKRAALWRAGYGRSGQRLPVEDIRRQARDAEKYAEEAGMMEESDRRRLREGILDRIRGLYDRVKDKFKKVAKPLASAAKKGPDLKVPDAEDAKKMSSEFTRHTVGSAKPAPPPEKKFGEKKPEPSKTTTEKPAAEPTKAMTTTRTELNPDKGVDEALLSYRAKKARQRGRSEASFSKTGDAARKEQASWKDTAGDENVTFTAEEEKAGKAAAERNAAASAKRRAARDTAQAALGAAPPGVREDLSKTASAAIRQRRNKAGEEIGGKEFDTEKLGELTSGLKNAGMKKTAKALKKGETEVATGAHQGIQDMADPEAYGKKIERMKRAQGRAEERVTDKYFNKKGIGWPGAVATASYYGATAMKDIAQASNSDQYRQAQAGITMSAVSRAGNLMESKTWMTRKRLYGPSGRRTKTWRYNPANTFHRRHTKRMTDEQFRKYVNSTADLTHRIGAKTAEGKGLEYTYFSNDRKQTYGGKTIGMRQKTIADHKKFDKPLPKGYENFKFLDVNNKFKKMQRWGFEKRMFNKAPLGTKIKIKGRELIGKIKHLLRTGKFTAEEAEQPIGSNIQETSESFNNIQESGRQEGCKFMEGVVSSPKECTCDDCLSVCRKLVEAVKETAATSFGQNLRGDDEELEEKGSGKRDPEEDEEDDDEKKKKRKEYLRRAARALRRKS